MSSKITHIFDHAAQETSHCQVQHREIKQHHGLYAWHFLILILILDVSTVVSITIDRFDVIKSNYNISSDSKRQEIIHLTSWYHY